MEISSETTSQHQFPYILNMEDPVIDNDMKNLTKLSKLFLGENQSNEILKCFNGKNKEKSKTNPKIIEKIFELRRELIDIEQIINQIEDNNKREMLKNRKYTIDTFLKILSRKYHVTIPQLSTINAKIMRNRLYINNPRVINHTMEHRKILNKEMVNERYWIKNSNCKYDSKEKRERIPNENWFSLKGNNFSKELHKNFAFKNSNFQRDYKLIFQDKK